MKKAELLQRIEGIPEFELLDVYTARDETRAKQPHFRAVVEKDRDHAIAMVSDRYNLVQIRELFRDAAEHSGEVEGRMFYFDGRGELELFPSKERVGLLVQNSVDLSSAVRISFCTNVNGATLLVPTRIAKPFVRIHTSHDLEIQIDNYFDLLAQVKRAWTEIVESVAGIELTSDDVEQIKERIHAGKRLGKLIDQHVYVDESQRTLAPIRFWEFVQLLLRAISGRRYKSELHRRRKIRKVGKVVVEWAVFERLKRSSETQ